MARFITEIHCKRRPKWLLSVLALFPYDRNKSFPDVERYAVLAVVLSYLVDFTYRRRNAIEVLGNSHHIETRENSITIKSINDVPYLTIKVVCED